MLSELNINLYVLIAIAVVLIIALLAISRIRIVKTGYVWSISRFGKHLKMWEAGIHYKLPFYKIVKKVSTKSRVCELVLKNIKSKDGIYVDVVCSLYFKIEDVYKFSYEVENFMVSMEGILTACVSEMVAGMFAEDIMSVSCTFNDAVQGYIEKSLVEWGVSFNRFVVTSVVLPREVRESLEKRGKSFIENTELVDKAVAVKEASFAKSVAKISTAEADKVLAELDTQKKLQDEKLRKELDMEIEAKRSQLFDEVEKSKAEREAVVAETNARKAKANASIALADEKRKHILEKPGMFNKKNW